MNYDIKDALTRAFDEEPALGIHRDEVLRKGRNRLRQRRLAVTGGMAVAITAVVLGTSLVSGAGGTRSGPVEPGTPGSQVLPTCAKPSVSPTVQPTSDCASVDVSTSQARADELTAVLAVGDVVPAGFTPRPVGGHHPSPLTFIPERKEYTASADLVAAGGGEGTVYVMVSASTANSPRADCKEPAVCEFRTVDGTQVQITTRTVGALGEIITMAYRQLPNGSHVYAMTSNVSIAAMGGGEGKAKTAPSIDRQPLNVDQLVKIVTLPGLKF